MSLQVCDFCPLVSLRAIWRSFRIARNTLPGGCLSKPDDLPQNEKEHDMRKWTSHTTRHGFKLLEVYQEVFDFHKQSEIG